MSLTQSKIIHDQNTDDVYLETFLIDALNLNDKNWKVSYDDPDSFDNIVKSSIGHPLVLYERRLPNGEKIWDHPVSETGSVDDDIEFQKPYIVGKAVHNKKIRDGLWHTSYKIIHEGAKRFLKSVKESSIDLFSSPHIVRPVLEDRQNIKTWAVVHNAIVSSPANGKQLAQVASICEGDPATSCSSLFASQTTPDDKDGSSSCGYCLGDSLKEYVTSHSSKTESSSNMSDNSQGPSPAGQGSQGQGQQQTSNPNPNDNANNQQLLHQQQQKQKVGNDSDNVQQNNERNDTHQQKTIAELTEKLKASESQNQSTNTFDEQTRKQESRIADLEKKLALRDRTANVEKLLTQAIDIYRNDDGSINEKEYNTNLDELVKEPYKIEHIQELIQAKFVLHQQAKGKLTGNKASNTSPDFSSQVSESASSNYTEMNDGAHTTDSSNTGNNNNNKSSSFVNVLNHINNERLISRSKFSQGGFS